MLGLVEAVSTEIDGIKDALAQTCITPDAVNTLSKQARVHRHTTTNERIVAVENDRHPVEAYAADRPGLRSDCDLLDQILRRQGRVLDWVECQVDADVVTCIGTPRTDRHQCLEAGRPDLSPIPGELNNHISAAKQIADGILSRPKTERPIPNSGR